MKLVVVFIVYAFLVEISTSVASDLQIAVEKRTASQFERLYLHTGSAIGHYMVSGNTAEILSTLRPSYDIQLSNKLELSIVNRKTKWMVQPTPVTQFLVVQWADRYGEFTGHIFPIVAGRVYFLIIADEPELKTSVSFEILRELIKKKGNGAR